ncbi:hypothetical protein AB0K11_14595 [Mycobacterium sp. NPDC050551]|uniref:hypothetical protein n=1 Tax=Mycobacterium sp. NPDC050551 TaxID=3155407 RepID=UPI0034297988
MTDPAQRAVKLLLPSAFGVLMVAAAAYRADGDALVSAAAALFAVAIAAWWRPAATVAVLLTVGTLLLAAPSPMYTALAGLAAAAYLVLRHGEGRAAAATVIGAVGFGVAAAVAVLLPVQLPWLPLAAPLVLLAGYLLAVRPYVGGAR